MDGWEVGGGVVVVVGGGGEDEADFFVLWQSWIDGMKEEELVLILLLNECFLLVDSRR